MAACKFSPDLKIIKPLLPVTCKIQDTQLNATVAEARLTDSAGKKTTLNPSSDKLSFTIPNTLDPGTYTLAIRIEGGQCPPPPVDVVEACDSNQLIVSIMDPTSKTGVVSMVVLP